MNLRLTLSLPCDGSYVSLIRKVADHLLRDVGVPREAALDIQLALSEACANAVRHAAGVEQYSITLVIDDDSCEIEIIDLGPGFDLVQSNHEADDESGRGIPLMRALVDDLRFQRDPAGMRVRLCKRWDRTSSTRPVASHHPS